jgi:ATP-binding cassette subfamily F protein 3
MDAEKAESRARTVLLGLGFKAEQIDAPMTNLSGGWRTRCDLACALCQTCDILLLDEPTNFLDLPSIIWLQDYINSDDLEETTVVTVTHDRDFADSVAQELLILRHQMIEVFKGNLSTYEREKLKKIRYLTKMKDGQDRQKKHMEQSIQNNIRAARKTGDDKKLKQAVSRQKKLDDRTGMQVNAKGHRFKLNRDLAGYSYTRRAGIDIPDFDPLPRIAFPALPPSLRFPGALVSLEDVEFRYPPRPKPAPAPASSSPISPIILSGINLTIHAGERYGLAGLNGSGKSTLVHLIDGQTTPTRGAITRHPRVRIARFSQHVVEDLDRHAALSHASSSSSTTSPLTALQHLIDSSSNSLDEPSARAVLGSLGLSGAAASEVPLARLSGGQKVRVALAKLVWTPPHLLVLDEVTTHLDGETILALVAALRAFEGAVLVVTHDRFFMRCVVEGASAAAISSRAALEAAAGKGDDGDEVSEDSEYEEALDRRKGKVFRVFRGGLKRLEGGMGEYEDIATRAAKRLAAKKKES